MHKSGLEIKDSHIEFLFQVANNYIGINFKNVRYVSVVKTYLLAALDGPYNGR